MNANDSGPKPTDRIASVEISYVLPPCDVETPAPIVWPEPESEIDRIWKAVQEVARGA
jgi:hypothetical protein